MLVATGMITLYACTEENNDEGGGYNSPNVSGNVVKISTSGGAITKNDMDIDFSSGTFDTEAEVALNTAKKGSIMGNKEASEFYTLTMPLSTNKPFKATIKAEKDDNVVFVAHTPSTSTHDVDQNTGYSDVILPAAYSNGAYTAEIPAFDNKGETDNVNVTFGLAKLSDEELTRAAEGASTRAVDDGDINWTKRWEEGYNNPKKEQIAADIDEAIKDAVTIIKGLGFKVKNHRIVPIIITSSGLKEDEFGQHRQSFVSDNWNDILLNSSLLFGSTYSKKKLRQTVIHEMFHYFQSAYDNRGCFRKAKFGNVTVMRIMESGGVWIEKFMDSSKYYDSSWIPYFDGVLQAAIDESTEGGKPMTNAQNKGYGSAIILQWFTYNKGDKAILQLYETWRDKGADDYKDWLKKCETATGCQFFEQFGDFVEMLAAGKVVLGSELVHDDGDVTRNRYNVNAFAVKGRAYIKTDGTTNFSSDVLQWGTRTYKISLRDYPEENIKGKQITINQISSSTITKAFLYNSTTDKATFLDLIYDTKPLVIFDETTLKNMTGKKATTILFLVSYQAANNKDSEKDNLEITLGESDNPMKRAKGVDFELKWENEKLYGTSWSYWASHNNLFSSSIGWSGYDVLEFESSNDAEGNVVLTGHQVRPSSTIYILSNGSYTLEDEYKLPGDYTSDTSMEATIVADLKNNKIVLKNGWLKYHYKTNENTEYGRTSDKLIEVELTFKDIVAEETISDWSNPNNWSDQYFTITDANLEKGTMNGTLFSRTSTRNTPFLRTDVTITDGWNINIRLRLRSK